MFSQTSSIPLGQPNWYKQEYKRAKSENRPADYRWGDMVTHVDVDGPDSSAQQPQEVPAPQCAAAAMMDGISMAPASSLHGGCPRTRSIASLVRLQVCS